VCDITITLAVAALAHRVEGDAVPRSSWSDSATA
jgi:hypothetical protein